MKVVVSILLLVGGVLNCAKAAPGLERNVTSSLDNFATDAQPKDSPGTTGIRLAREFPSLAVERGPLSVVQDWSLVCVQLCGASLGGGPCAPYCTSITVPVSVQKSNAEILLSPNKDLICEDLCALKLGGNFCTCSTLASVRSIQDRNQVCQTFCINNSETLAGCSLCNKIQPLKEWTTEDLMPDKNAPVADPSKNTDFFISPASSSSSSSSSSSISKPSNSKHPAANAAGVTTPDWDALCVSLCKTNDGGSLCNCDLSPFL
ncbi:uncharacterized protein LOC129948221 [Eupeodes corollae]|uniref:uncharacterized protein LOC129948221 n=1 Tax=Eupeodes corollae TaxID=290404 RepID=UPI002491D11C|nr:uncharacterized protein LOC129948221 [Eupeodes corollae]